jgi:hypothetical protein
MRDVHVEEKFHEFRKLVVATKFSQVYTGVGNQVLGIKSSITLRLLFWIIDRMDDDNFIVLRKAEKTDFLTQCFIAGGDKKSVSSVNRAIKELVDKRLMVSINDKGERLGKFFVNPGYFWKSKSQHERTNRVKEYYEFLKFKTNEKD